MSTLIGTRLGPYEILSPLGSGGMGEVYRARDTKLGREVALKVLPDSFLSDPDRLSRFEREAQVLASLNHPHVGSIYGLEESGSRRALVLELVEGPTLADRIADGPVPLDEAIPIARQIAEALEAAHDKGIVHRDLKPANIKLTPGGKVKVLDFGLAKLHDPAASGASPSTSPSASAMTMSPAMTGVGVIVGTAAYMSPEQAKGRAIDRRADIWAFGCVLYEMLAGRAAFAGGSMSEIVSEVLKTEPDWQRLSPGTPPAIRRLLGRCLQKDPARRLHHIADARLDLDEPIGAAPAGPIVGVPSPQPSRLARALPWAVAALALAASGWVMATRPETGAAATLRLELNIPPGVEMFNATTNSMAVSPDGTRLAFVGVRGGARAVYVRSLDSFEAVPVRGSENATMCLFSPDGGSIALVDAGGLLKTIDLSNGTVTSVTNDVSFIAGVSWGDGNRMVFARSGELWQVTIGSAPTQLTKLDGPPRDREHSGPTILPGGNAVVFAAASMDDVWRLDVLDLATRTRRTIAEGSVARYVASGHLVFYREGELFAAPFDLDSRSLAAVPVKMLDLPLFGGTIPDLDVSLSGTLAYAPLTSQSDLVWVTRDGAEQPLSDTSRPYVNPRLSPSGTGVVVQAGDLWLQDLRRAAFTRLGTTDSVGFPIWTPDGRQVVYKISAGLGVLNADGSGESRVIPGTGPFDYPASFTPDGRTLIMLRSSQETSFDTYAMPFPGGGKLTPILATKSYEGGARLSPSGRWLVYVSNDSGQNEVYVRPYPGPDRRVPVSTAGGTQPTWDPQGTAIYYRAGNKMMTVGVSFAGDDITLASPRQLFERQYAYGAGITIANYDVTADGERFVMVKDESSAGRLNVVLNWQSDLNRLAPPP